MQQFLIDIGIALGSGGMTGLLSIVAMKIDISWIKKIQDQHDNRISSLEKRECGQ